MCFDPYNAADVEDVTEAEDDAEVDAVHVELERLEAVAESDGEEAVNAELDKLAERAENGDEVAREVLTTVALLMMASIASEDAQGVV